MLYNKKPHRTGDLILKVLRETGERNLSHLLQIQYAWKQIVGRVNSQHSWPYSLNRGTLTIKTCDDETWKKTFKALSSILIERIHDLLQYPAVQKLRIQKSKTWNFRESSGIRKAQVSQPTKPPVIDKMSRVEMDEALSSVQDPELRKLIEKVWAKDLSSKQMKEKESE